MPATTRVFLCLPRKDEGTVVREPRADVWRAVRVEDGVGSLAAMGLSPHTLESGDDVAPCFFDDDDGAARDSDVGIWAWRVCDDWRSRKLLLVLAALSLPLGESRR